MSKSYINRYSQTKDDIDSDALDALQYQRETFEKYITRSSDRADQRADLLNRYKNGEPLFGSKGLRKELASFDLQYFGMVYIPHYFITPPPPFHDELDRTWILGVIKGLNVLTDPKQVNRREGCREAIAAPRGHAKSTTITFKDPLHAILYQYKHYILILSDSSDQAESFLEDIRSELEDNPYIKEDFGDLKGDRYWRNSGFLTSTNIKVEGIGSGKKIRGRRHKQWRPDLILLDDVENDVNINTPEQRTKLKTWFNKAVSSAGAAYTDILYVGTVLHYDSLLCYVMSRPRYHSKKYRAVISFADNTVLWEAWLQIYTDLENENHQEDALAFFEANREEMLAGVSVLWEAKNSYYALMVQKVDLGDAAFNSEFQNEPTDPSVCPFSEQTLTFYDDNPPDFRDQKFVFFGANDPSLGKNRRSDTSHIPCIALDTTTGLMYVVESDIEQRKPDKIIADAIGMQIRLKQVFKRGFRMFGVESVQFQAYFAEVMAKESAKQGEYLPIVQIPSLLPKAVRIESLIPFAHNGYLRFSKKHKKLLDQMYQWPLGKNDDGPDGLEMALKLAVGAKTGSKTEYRSVLSRLISFKKGAY